jgi:hypothetical protein
VKEVVMETVHVARLGIDVPRDVAEQLTALLPELDRLGILRSKEEIDDVRAAVLRVRIERATAAKRFVYPEGERRAFRPETAAGRLQDPAPAKDEGRGPPET